MTRDQIAYSTFTTLLNQRDVGHSFRADNIRHMMSLAFVAANEYVAQKTQHVHLDDTDTPKEVHVQKDLLLSNTIPTGPVPRGEDIS